MSDFSKDSIEVKGVQIKDKKDNVISMGDIVPNGREINKKDVDEYVKNMKMNQEALSNIKSKKDKNDNSSSVKNGK